MHGDSTPSRSLTGVESFIWQDLLPEMTTGKMAKAHVEGKQSDDFFVPHNRHITIGICLLSELKAKLQTGTESL